VVTLKFYCNGFIFESIRYEKNLGSIWNVRNRLRRNEVRFGTYIMDGGNFLKLVLESLM
jgi:hypothetical protein